MAIVCYCSSFHSNCGEILFVFPPFMLIVIGFLHRHCEECLNDAVSVGMEHDSIISNSLLNHFTKLNGGEDITRATQWLSG